EIYGLTWYLRYTRTAFQTVTPRDREVVSFFTEDHCRK
nr:hypothetical protein [Tanacetum cinerariifolium]